MRQDPSRVRVSLMGAPGSCDAKSRDDEVTPNGTRQRRCELSCSHGVAACLPAHRGHRAAGAILNVMGLYRLLAEPVTARSSESVTVAGVRSSTGLNEGEAPPACVFETTERHSRNAPSPVPWTSRYLRNCQRITLGPPKLAMPFRLAYAELLRLSFNVGQNSRQHVIARILQTTDPRVSQKALR